MSNARFSILQARAISDKNISDAQFRTLAALGMYADKNGWCFPSLKTLGKDLNKSAQAVGRDTIALRKLGYLQVKNRYDAKTKSRHSNLYRLLFDFNVDDSTLSTPEVDTLSTPEVDVNVPLNDLNNNSFSKKTKIKGIEWAMVQNRKVTNDDLPMMELALKEFESALSLPANWNWYPAKSGDEKAWRELRDFIFEKWQADNGAFRKYSTWRATPYVKGALSNLAIQRRPTEFITSWSDYLASDSMINSKTAPEYKPLPEDNNVYVPNPNRRTS